MGGIKETNKMKNTKIRELVGVCKVDKLIKRNLGTRCVTLEQAEEWINLLRRRVGGVFSMNQFKS